MIMLMDPSKAQEDAGNDADSLSKGGAEDAAEPQQHDNESAEPDSEGVIDASGGTQASPEETATHESLFKRLWRKFNIFLLLFILLLAIAVGTTVVLIFHDAQVNAPRDDVTTQDLSETSLMELARSTVTVGDPQHVLNVQSHAIFDGSMLVRGDVEIAGGIQVGDSINLPSITVAGDGSINQLQAEDAEINNNLSVQGDVTAHSGIQVSGDGQFDGDVSAATISADTLQLNDNLQISAHIVVAGPAPSAAGGPALGAGGTVSVNGSDTAGTVNINTGSNPPAGCFATITFASAYAGTPHVIVSPVGSSAGALDYYVNRSATNFSICAANTPPAGQNFGFDYWVAG